MFKPKLLIDTHILLWLNKIDGTLDTDVIKKLADFQLCVSMASYWEIAVKCRIKKLKMPMSLPHFIEKNELAGITTIKIKPLHLHYVSVMPSVPNHKDPFDHLLIATAKIENMEILTFDTKVKLYFD